MAAPRASHPLPTPSADTLELKATKENAHNREISSVAYAPDGKTIVSACYGGTIKVWDAGAPKPPNRLFLAKTDAPCLPTQPHWS